MKVFSTELLSGQQVHLVALLFVIAYMPLLQSCNKKDPEPDNYLTEPVCQEPFTPKSFTYHVIGFYPSYKHEVLPISEIEWDRITRVVYAFAYPNADGTLNVDALTQTEELVSTAHAHGVEVYFSVGGGADSDNFPVLAADKKKRNTFIKEVRHYVFAHCFDGVDIDWEHWSGASSNKVIDKESSALVFVLKELQEDLAPHDKKISIDLYGSDWGGKHYYDEAAVYADYLQVMAYDFSGSWSDPGPHSSYEDAIGSGSGQWTTGMAYWINYRGWPKEKVVLGVPFYGRDFDQNGKGIAYRDIVSQFPEAPGFDQMENIYFNGLETIQRKTNWVIDNQISGIMIWELAQDIPVDSISLLQAIHEVIHP
jgi:GH18 family chitinase